MNGLDDLVRDIRLAFRTRRRTPGLTLTAVVTLALGIGVNIGMFNLVNGLLLRPLYERAEGVLAIYGRATTAAGGCRAISYPDYLDIRDATAGLFEQLAASSTAFVGLDLGDGARRTMASAVTANYFPIFDSPLRLGRAFTDAELAAGSSEPVALVDDALADRLWPRGDTLGRQIQFLDVEGVEAGRAMRIVGIVPALEHSLGNPQPFPHVYVPLGQHYESAMTLQLRVADDAADPAMLAAVGRVVRSVDPRVPVLRLETWREHLDASLEMWVYRAGARVFSAFGGIALLLAVLGVYGVKSYVVSLRTREFGIRIATGAQPRGLLWQVMREGSRIKAIGIGIGIGLVLAVGLGRLLSGFLYGVRGVEPVVLITAPSSCSPPRSWRRPSRRGVPRTSIRQWRCAPSNGFQPVEVRCA